MNTCNEEVKVDQKKMQMIKVRVYNLERKNFTNKKLPDHTMVEEIMKIINTEANNDNK